MKSAIASLLLAATLGAQQPAFDWGATCPTGQQCLSVASPRMVAELKEYSYSDGNGALEAFYLQKPEKTYYWYSPQQENTMREIAENNGRLYFRKTVRVKGSERIYTEITHTKKPFGYWPDYRLVTVSKGGN